MLATRFLFFIWTFGASLTVGPNRLSIRCHHTHTTHTAQLWTRWIKAHVTGSPSLVITSFLLLHHGRSTIHSALEILAADRWCHDVFLEAMVGHISHLDLKLFTNSSIIITASQLREILSQYIEVIYVSEVVQLRQERVLALHDFMCLKVNGLHRQTTYSLIMLIL